MYYKIGKESFCDRMRHLRGMSGLSRSSFSKNFQFPLPTIKQWEDSVLSNKINIRSMPIERYLDIYNKKLGIYVSLEWVLNESGTPPYHKHIYNIELDSVIKLLKTSGAFFLFLNKNLELQCINGQYTHLISDSSPENLKDKSILEILDSEQYNSYYPVLLKALAGKTSNFLLTTKSDNTKQISIKCEPVYNSAGELLGICNLFNLRFEL